MHPSQSAAARQQRHVLARSERTDSHAFFNLLTGAQLFDDVEALLPEHRERLFPPTETLQVREFHAGGKIMVTTFLCPKDAPKATLKALYRNRWNVELDLRNIKTTLGMEHLRCKTPEMALKELRVYLLAYNLIRLLMAQAALLADRIPRQLSFKHTVQVWIVWQQRAGATHDGAYIRRLLILIAQPRVGRRPGRIAPRVLKRRPKKYPLLTQPRPTAREEVRLNAHPKKQR